MIVDRKFPRRRVIVKYSDEPLKKVTYKRQRKKKLTWDLIPVHELGEGEEREKIEFY